MSIQKRRFVTKTPFSPNCLGNFHQKSLLNCENSAKRIAQRLDDRDNYQHYADKTECNYGIQAPIEVDRYIKGYACQNLYHRRESRDGKKCAAPDVEISTLKVVGEDADRADHKAQSADYR